MNKEIKKLSEETKDVVITKELLKEVLCPTATDAELKLAVGICKSYGLNPFKREVHIIKYGTSPASVVVGYEVYIKRAKHYPTYENFRCTVEGTAPDMVAKCVIYDSTWQHPFEWEAYYEECAQTKQDGSYNKNWSTKPKFMLRKVCIAQALRLAYPDEFGGMPYIEEEAIIYEETPTAMPQEKKETQPPSAPQPPSTEKKATEKQISAIGKMANMIGRDPGDVRARDKFNITTMADLTMTQASELITELGKEMDATK